MYMLAWLLCEDRTPGKNSPANQHALRPQTQSFDDIDACPDTTVEQHSKLVSDLDDFGISVYFWGSDMSGETVSFP